MAQRDPGVDPLPGHLRQGGGMRREARTAGPCCPLALRALLPRGPAQTLPADFQPLPAAERDLGMAGWMPAGEICHLFAMHLQLGSQQYVEEEMEIFYSSAYNAY